MPREEGAVRVNDVAFNAAISAAELLLHRIPPLGFSVWGLGFRSLGFRV